MLPMHRVHFRRSKMADGRLITGFRRALLGSSLFAHVTPLDRVEARHCDSWEHLVTIG